MTMMDDARQLPRAAKPSAPADFPLALSAIVLSPTSLIPLYEQICRGIRNAVSAGDLQPGTAMPTIVELARALGVARNTVGEAYTRLSAEGYLISYKRRGTRIAEQMPRAAERVDRHKTSAQKPALEISHYARRVLGEPSVPMPNARPFALHTPDPALFPRAQLARLVMEEFRRPPQEAQTTQYGDCKRFQAAVAAYLRHASGVHCEPQQVIAVSGHEAALALTARVLIDPGHRVLVQDPSILAARAMFADAGARIEALPVDAKGADPKTISGPPPRLIWVSPALSFPLGVQMTEARRLAVLDAARHAGAAIFESSSYGDLVYSGHRLRAIQGHDNEGRVIYYGSFQRTLGPGMRLGYLIVPPALVDAFCKMRRRIAGGPELFLQSAMATFIGENRYALHLKKVRGIYAGRLRMLMAACRKHIPQASFTEPVGGFHLALNFSDGTDEQRVYAAAAKDGFQVQPLSQFYQDPRNGTGLVLGFGAMADAFIEPAIVRLAASIREAAPPH